MRKPCGHFLSFVRCLLHKLFQKPSALCKWLHKIGRQSQFNESESQFVNMFSYSETFDKVLNISCKKKMCILVS